MSHRGKSTERGLSDPRSRAWVNAGVEPRVSAHSERVGPDAGGAGGAGAGTSVSKR